MRELHNFADEQLARRFVHVLRSRQMPAHAEPEGSRWVVWIENDDHREAARALLTEFEANPDAEPFAEAETTARQLAREAQQSAQNRRRLQRDLRDRWNGVWWKNNPVTTVMVVLCVLVVMVCTDWPRAEMDHGFIPRTCNLETSVIRNALWIQKPVITITSTGEDVARFERIPPKEAVKTWQIWRFVTPAFIHLNVLHIYFNMVWLRTLGSAIEFVRGSKRFLLLFLVIAVVSNIAQLFVAGPGFGGMSGVDFGLIGYVWMKGKTQPRQGLALSPEQVVWSMLWMLLCLGGAFGNIANAAHVGGLIAGVVIGSRTAIWKKLTVSK